VANKSKVCHLVYLYHLDKIVLLLLQMKVGTDKQKLRILIVVPLQPCMPQCGKRCHHIPRKEKLNHVHFYNMRT